MHFDVIAPGTESRGRVNAVRFTPGARTAWHRHAHGQTLPVTEGVGLSQSRGATWFRRRGASTKTRLQS